MRLGFRVSKQNSCGTSMIMLYYRKKKNLHIKILYALMKILVIMDILIFQFYGYIRDISTDILEKKI